MIKNLKLTKRRKLLAAVIICVALITGSTMLWQMGQVAEAAILDPHPGLVGWWRFDEGSGTVAEDSSGNGNHGTVYGATPVDGKYGKALSFDGVDDYVDVPHSADFQIATTNELSVELWVNVTAFLASEMLINKGGEWMLYPLASPRNQIRVMTRADGAWKWGTHYTLAANTWYHVVATWNFTDTTLTTNLYINGNLQKTDAFEVSTLDTSGQPLRIGYRWTDYFSGVIDEVRIYNRALSAAEIQVIFQKDPDLSSRLLAKVPKGTTQFIATLSWQGSGSINATIESHFETYTEDMVPVYQKTVYSSSSGDMLNIKRLAISVTALPNDENWYILLEFDEVEDYKITIEVQT